MRYFTPDHEWLELDGNHATIGITDFAQNQLGDVVYVDLPATGRSFKAKDAAAVVESVKAASDVYAPVDGTVTEQNAALSDSPGLVNSDPTGAGWFFKMTLANPEQTAHLMTEAAYLAYIQGL